jgi:hypothetical protein
MKLIYIIGPFRAANAWLVEQNIRRAEEAALTLWSRGFAVICPHTNTRFFDGFLSSEVFLNGDLEILKRCDAAICVEGYKNSLGACHEIEFCKEKRIPVYFNSDDLIYDLTE